MTGMRKRKKAQVDEAACVACGCCVRVCPVEAIGIHRGRYAQINEAKCVGCGRCAKECPATVILLREVTV